MMDPARWRAPLEAALRATRAQVMEAFAAAPAEATYKDDGTAITELDFALERRLVDVLLGLDPALGVFSEEAGWVREGSPAWHLDPLDGTANFARRLPIFATQVALVEGVTPGFAAIYEPLRDDLAWAAAGAGAWREGRRLHMRDLEPTEARVYVDLSRRGLFHEDPGCLDRIRSGVYRVRVLGSAAINLRDVAAGVADGYVGGRPEGSPLHDLAPGALLVREAGGHFTDLAGQDGLIDRSGVVAAPSRLHAWLRAQVASRP